MQAIDDVGDRDNPRASLRVVQTAEKMIDRRNRNILPMVHEPWQDQASVRLDLSA